MPKMKGTSNTSRRDTQTRIISSSTYFAVQISLKYILAIARILSYSFFLCKWWWHVEHTGCCGLFPGFYNVMTKTNYD